MDYGRLGMGTSVASLDDLPVLLAQQGAAVHRGAASAGPQGGAAARIACEIGMLAQRQPEGIRA
jgi:hypothetical protein